MYMYAYAYAYAYADAGKGWQRSLGASRQACQGCQMVKACSFMWRKTFRAGSLVISEQIGGSTGHLLTIPNRLSIRCRYL